MSWAEKHRPRKFEDVLGQSEAIDTLSRLVLSTQPRSVVISGPTGTGKTTLAKIYAQALLCAQHAPSGSPCLVCESCVAFEGGRPSEFRQFDPDQQHVDELRYITQDLQPYAPLFARMRVYFFDEARTLGTRLEILHDEIDRPTHPAAFIFTLIEAERMPAPTRDRLTAIELAPAQPSVALAYLKRICEAERVEHEQEAIELLAEVNESFRRAAVDLEQVAGFGPVTVSAVYEHVLSARLSWIIRYFHALAGGDRQEQLLAIEERSQEPCDQLASIRRLLADLKLRHISPGPQQRRYSLVSDADALDVLACFQALAQSLTVPLWKLWDGLMDYWARVPEQVSRDSIRLHVLRLHDRLHGVVDSVAQLGKAFDEPRRTRRDVVTRAVRLRRGQTQTTSRLSIAQAQAIYEAATFALQAYWAPFNVQLGLHWSKDIGEAEVRTTATEFVRQLQMRVEHWGCVDVGGFHRILLQERPEGTWRSTLVGHVPGQHHTRLERWVANQQSSGWRAEIRLQARVVGEPVQRHWHLVRMLWRGLDPTATLTSGQLASEALRVPRPWHAAGAIGALRRYSTSETIGVGARKKAASEVFPHLSAWDAGRWDWLYKGWEKAEFEYRIQELNLRQREKVALTARSPEADGLAGIQIRSASEKIKKDQMFRLSLRKTPWVA